MNNLWKKKKRWIEIIFPVKTQEKNKKERKYDALIVLLKVTIVIVLIINVNLT